MGPGKEGCRARSDFLENCRGPRSCARRRVFWFSGGCNLAGPVLGLLAKSVAGRAAVCSVGNGVRRRVRPRPLAVYWKQGPNPREVDLTTGGSVAWVAVPLMVKAGNNATARRSTNWSAITAE